VISKRSGYLLFEVLIVLVIISGLLCCFIWQKPPPRDELTAFKREFAKCYIAERQQQVIDKHSFYIGSFNDGNFWVGNIPISLPPNWYILNQRLTCKPHYMQPGTIGFMHEETGQQLRLVFQLGGGTYDFR